MTFFSVSDSSHEEYDCFACAILTHGSKDDVLYARDGQMKLKEFTSPFHSNNCPSLAGKPKLFFVQVICFLKAVWGNLRCFIHTRNRGRGDSSLFVCRWH